MAVRESLESHPGSVHDIAGILGPRITQSVDTAWKWPNQQLQASCEIPVRDGIGEVKLGGGEFVRGNRDDSACRWRPPCLTRPMKGCGRETKHPALYSFQLTSKTPHDSDPSIPQSFLRPPQHRRQDISAILICRAAHPDEGCHRNADFQAPVLVFHRVDSFLAQAVVVVDDGRRDSDHQS